ncbi:uncharacterized protein VTP21DRAFT_7591 [Calcarisporiella thermophila]|uniref:uncharacterized protein n=1 Tax=Calcarisporiella thermophila TaxID=911321 RepID=UPI0037440EBB
MTLPNGPNFDAKLASLSTLFENVPMSKLECALRWANGDVNEAAAILCDSSLSPKRKKQRQMRLNEFVKKPVHHIPAPVPAITSPSSSSKPMRTLNETLQPWTSQGDKMKKTISHAKFLVKPEHVAEHTPCELLLNALSPSFANELLLEMLEEAKQWGRNQWWLFEREVTSPHTTSFYYANTTDYGYEEGQDYYYNGFKTEKPRCFPPLLEEARKIVQHIVNERLSYRDRHPFEIQGEWIPNVAIGNSYASSKESINFLVHFYTTLHLTYLGPRPIIVSLSLGVTRQFRLRRMPLSDSTGNEKPGQLYSIPLPHNSILIMHPPTQEEFRHEVPSQRTIELHPVSGSTRINITFRSYRPEFSPRYTPRCHCGISCVLRVVQKQEQTLGRYFYACYSGGAQQDRTCGYFEWLDVEKRLKQHREQEKGEIAEKETDEQKADEVVHEIIDLKTNLA